MFKFYGSWPAIILSMLGAMSIVSYAFSTIISMYYNNYDNYSTLAHAIKFDESDYEIDMYH